MVWCAETETVSALLQVYQLPNSGGGGGGAVADLLDALEAKAPDLGIRHFAVSGPTLEEVFLAAAAASDAEEAAPAYDRPIASSPAGRGAADESAIGALDRHANGASAAAGVASGGMTNGAHVTGVSGREHDASGAAAGSGRLVCSSEQARGGVRSVASGGQVADGGGQGRELGPAAGELGRAGSGVNGVAAADQAEAAAAAGPGGRPLGGGAVELQALGQGPGDNLAGSLLVGGSAASFLPESAGGRASGDGGAAGGSVPARGAHADAAVVAEPPGDMRLPSPFACGGGPSAAPADAAGSQCAAGDPSSSREANDAGRDAAQSGDTVPAGSLGEVGGDAGSASAAGRRAAVSPSKRESARADGAEWSAVSLDDTGGASMQLSNVARGGQGARLVGAGNSGAGPLGALHRRRRRPRRWWVAFREMVRKRAITAGMHHCWTICMKVLETATFCHTRVDLADKVAYC